MSFYSRVKLNLYGKNVLKYLESKFKSLVFKLFIIIIIITIVISMFCFRFDNGYTLYDVWNCRAAVALTSYYGRASLARRKQRRLQTSEFSVQTQKRKKKLPTTYHYAAAPVFQMQNCSF